MKLSKILARNFIFPSLLFFKYDNYLLRGSKKNCCIINFHGVRSSDKEVFNNRHIPVNEFEKIIVYLKNRYTIVPLEEMFEIYRTNKKLKKKTVSLTFDDGYKNNFITALPVLKKYNVPATFYLISRGLVEHDFFLWPDAIDLIKKYNKDININNYLFKAPLYYNEELKLELLGYLKGCGPRTIDLVKDILRQHPEIQTKIKELSEYTSLIKPDELLNYINEPLLEFGSHTHSHFNLEFLSNHLTQEELKQSKAIIEEKTGKKVISLAFPDGSYTKETIEISKNAGYINLVAVDYKFNENNLNNNLLSRFTISNSTTFQSNILRLAKEFDKYGFN